MCPLLGGCPFLGGSFIKGSTVAIIIFLEFFNYRIDRGMIITLLGKNSSIKDLLEPKCLLLTELTVMHYGVVA